MTLTDGTEYAVELMRTEYANLGPTLATEILQEKHSITIERETLRRGLRNEGATILPRRISLFLAMLLALLMTAAGCRNSTKTGSAGRESSARGSVIAKPVPKAPTEVHPPSSLPIKVQSPASFSRDQLPQDGVVEFLVSGNAGEFLTIRVNEVANPQYEDNLSHTIADTTEARYSVAVQLAEAGASVIKAVQEAATCTNNSLYELPQSGTYKVVLDSSRGHRLGRSYGIDFTLLRHNDPLIDPGITPEQISIDFGGFAEKKHVSVVPLAMADGCVDDSWPSHLAIRSGSFEFRVISVTGYKKLFPKDESMLLLKSGLQLGAGSISAEKFPYAAAYEDAGSVMTTRREILRGEGWRGLRWIGGYAQDGDYPGGLGYVFEGITDDDRFFILMRTPISHPDLRRLAPNSNQSNSKRAKEETDMRIHLEKGLVAATPSSFQPDLKQLDAVIESLRFIR